jgi:hypothetical protein
MDRPTKSNSEINAAKSVHVELRDGTWVVCVLDEAETFEREFILEAHANAFADGQRIRLGVFGT